MVNSSGVHIFVYVMGSSRFRQELTTFACFRFLKRKKAELKKEGVTVNTKTTESSAVSSSETLYGKSEVWCMISFVKQRYTNTCVNSFSTSTLRQMALARMLVIVSTIYILTASPIVALSIARSTVYDLFIYRSYNIRFCFVLLSHAIYLQFGMLNSSGVNFFVYVLRSSWIRQEKQHLCVLGF